MALTPISIIDASESDLPEMIQLRCDAAEEDLLTRFLYGIRHAEATQKETASLLSSLGKRFTKPTNRCHIVKAVDTQTNEIVGWALVRWEDGSWVYGRSAPLSDVEPATFARQYGSMVRQRWKAILGGRPHVVLGAANVKVDRQRQGIGRLIIQHLYSTYELERELVVVQTVAPSEGFYQKLGWVTVDSTDVDLSKWGGEGRGYGMHRSPQMLRYPTLS